MTFPLWPRRSAIEPRSRWRNAERGCDIHGFDRRETRWSNRKQPRATAISPGSCRSLTLLFASCHKICRENGKPVPDLDGFVEIRRVLREYFPATLSPAHQAAVDSSVDPLEGQGPFGSYARSPVLTSVRPMLRSYDAASPYGSRRRRLPCGLRRRRRGRIYCSGDDASP